MRAAAHVFAEKGFHRATIRAVAQAASLGIDGWTRQTIQQRFAVIGPDGRRVFQVVLAEGAARPANPALALRMTAAMFLGVLVQQLIGDPVLDAHAAELPEVMADILLHGLMKENPHA